MVRYLVSVLLLCGLGFPSAYAEMVPGADINSVKEATRIDVLLRQPESEMDLARIKLTVDKMIDSAIDVDAGVKQIDEMAGQIRSMLPVMSSSRERLQALQAYIYVKGPWNGYQSFGYDLDDPFGKNIHNKLLPNYIKSRKGNCISMPLLFVILGQRLGLDVTISTAPLHLFVKYTDDETGVTCNLEATSGAQPARDVWIRQQNPMTDEAIANGLYMRKLSKRETAAEIALTLTEYFGDRREYEKVIALSDVVLKYNPKCISSMLWKGSAYGRISTRDFVKKYSRSDLIPPDKWDYYTYLGEQNLLWFTKAEALGWREPSKEQEAKYAKTINRAKAAQ